MYICIYILYARFPLSSGAERSADEVTKGVEEEGERERERVRPASRESKSGGGSIHEEEEARIGHVTVART